MSTPKRDACAICVRDNYKPGEELHVHPMVTTIREIPVCAIHTPFLLARAMPRLGDIDEDTNQILADVELEQRQGMPR